MAVIVKDLRYAPRLLPKLLPGESISTAAERDQSSAAAQLVKVFYITPHLLFCVFTFAILYLGSLFCGPSYQTFVALSIAASTLTIACGGIWVYWTARHVNGKDDWRSLCAGAVGLFAAAVPFYSQLFSPWGAHNFGVLGLSCAGFCTTRALIIRPGPRTCRPVVLAGFAQVLAFYSHWTCLLLIPPATAVAILLADEQGVKRRVSIVAKYCLFVLFCTGPAVLPIVMIHSTPASSGIVYTGLQDRGVEGLDQLSHRFILWFSSYSLYFSFPGLFAGLWGLGLLAIEDRIVFPLAIAVGHLTVWTFMPGFTWNGSPTELRTLNYLLPVFGVGVAWALVRSIVHKRTPNKLFAATNIVFMILAVAHLTLQLKADNRLSAVVERLPQFATAYARGQGLLRFMSRDLDERLPNDPTLIPSNYEIRDLYEVLTSRREVQFAPALDSFWIHYRDRDLQQWISRRNLSVNCNAVFVLTGANSDSAPMDQALIAALGPSGLRCGKSFRFEKVYEYETQLTTMDELTLYKILVLN